MQPLAMLFYENLLTGNQLVNQLRELGYRTTLVPELSRTEAVAVQERPLVFLAEVATQAEAVAEAIHALKRNPQTAHVPVLAYGKLGNTKADRKRLATIQAAGTDLVAAEAGLAGQLPRLLDQVLRVD